MFTGIISDYGHIKAHKVQGDTRIEVACGYDMAEVALGASIACSGMCLTVVDKGADWFAADISQESLNCTNATSWHVGTQLNLERALKMGEELGGHIVTGHVDGVGEILRIEPSGASHIFHFSAPKALTPYIAAKGSICLNGVSLTVNSVEDTAQGTEFTVNIIPHTGQKTSFGTARMGDAINIEIDVLARYLMRMNTART
jgi:riboflavin synthase